MRVGDFREERGLPVLPRLPDPPLRAGPGEEGPVGAKSERERDFINALAVLYTDYDKTAYPVRLQGYLKAMEALAAKNPGDDETQILYAITLNVSASPADKTYANQLKGAAILDHGKLIASGTMRATVFIQRRARVRA